MFNKREETNDQALRPDTFSMTSYVKEPAPEKTLETLTTEERVLGEGANHMFWKILQEHFAHEMENIERINETAMAQGAPREQIGENTIIISLVKGVLKRIVGIVNDAKEAVDGQTGQTGQGKTN